jgi:hypothetical protein
MRDFIMKTSFIFCMALSMVSTGFSAPTAAEKTDALSPEFEQLVIKMILSKTNEHSRVAALPVLQIEGCWQNNTMRWRNEFEFSSNGKVKGWQYDGKWSRSRPVTGSWKASTNSPALQVDLIEEYARDMLFYLYIVDGQEELRVMTPSSIGKRSGVATSSFWRSDSGEPVERPLRVSPSPRIYPARHAEKKGNEIQVTVLGAVIHPGLYYLEEDWSIHDFIEFCGLQPPNSSRRFTLRRNIDGKETIYRLHREKAIPDAIEDKLKDGDIYHIEYIWW